MSVGSSYSFRVDLQWSNCRFLLSLACKVGLCFAFWERRPCPYWVTSSVFFNQAYNQRDCASFLNFYRKFCTCRFGNSSRRYFSFGWWPYSGTREYTCVHRSNWGAISTFNRFSWYSNVSNRALHCSHLWAVCWECRWKSDQTVSSWANKRSPRSKDKCKCRNTWTWLDGWSYTCLVFVLPILQSECSSPQWSVGFTRELSTCTSPTRF